jgi:hypothetical protein
MTPTQSARTSLCTTLLAATLVSCGGDSGAFDDGVDMTGFYTGNFTPEGTDLDEARLMVDSDGRFVLFTMPYLYVGELRTSGNSFTAKADAFSFYPGFANGSDTTMSGSVSGKVVTGTFAGGGLSGSLSLAYSTGITSIPTATDTFTGSHPSSMNLGESYYATGTITALPDGSFAADYGDGCTVDGQISVRVADRNLYGFAAQAKGCATNGSVRGGLGYQTFDGELLLYGSVGNTPVRIYLGNTG